jgi:hypothetical protein
MGASAGRSRGKQLPKSLELLALRLWITFPADLHKKAACEGLAANPHGRLIPDNVRKSYPQRTLDTTSVMLNSVLI